MATSGAYIPKQTVLQLEPLLMQWHLIRSVGQAMVQQALKRPHLVKVLSQDLRMQACLTPCLLCAF